MTAEDSNGTGIVFTVKDWAKLVYDELRELQDKYAMCQAQNREIPEIKADLKCVTHQLDELSDVVLTIKVKAEEAEKSASKRAVWISLVAGGGITGIIEAIIHLI